jgi:hypothetical protein
MQSNVFVDRIGRVAVALGAFLAGASAMAQGEAAARGVADFVGAWQFVEDRTAAEHGRDPRERPPLGNRFRILLEGRIVSVEQVRQGIPQVWPFALDGKAEEQKEGETLRSYAGRFEGGSLHLSMRVDAPGQGGRAITTTEYTLTKTKEGLLVRMLFREPTQLERSALFAQVEDVPPAKPAPGTLEALDWLVGLHAGSEGNASMEEHWGAAAGGAMLGTARTVKGGKMVSFEYLRILERGGSLVYVAQPGGGTPVEFVLTELSATGALFENPYHDYPKRIFYERLGEDGLATEISDSGGARPQRASYRRAR